MLVYKDDFVQKSFVPTIREEEHDNHDPPGEDEDDEHRDEIFSIIGHLERDERKLVEKLRDSPDLAEPIIEAQAQLNRLKSLMCNIFGRSTGAAVEIRQDGHRKEPRVRAVAAEASGTLQLEMTKFEERPFASFRGTGERPTLDETRPPPSESTRLDGMAEGVGRDQWTPRPAANFGQHLFSPIAHLDGGNGVIQLDGGDPTPFSRRTGSASGAQPDVPEDDDDDDAEEEAAVRNGGLSYERSLTRWSLSDLSRRLGGTGLCYSRDSLLQITEELQGGAERSNGNSYGDTAEELEKLMLSLSGMYCMCV